MKIERKRKTMWYGLKPKLNEVCLIHKDKDLAGRYFLEGDVVGNCPECGKCIYVGSPYRLVKNHEKQRFDREYYDYSRRKFAFVEHKVSCSMAETKRLPRTIRCSLKFANWVADGRPTFTKLPQSTRDELLSNAQRTTNYEREMCETYGFLWRSHTHFPLNYNPLRNIPRSKEKFAQDRKIHREVLNLKRARTERLK